MRRLFLLLPILLGGMVMADDESKPRERIRAPELDGGVGWLNTDKPIKLSELRGKVVLLDFWTFCCINCMHVLPDLKKLEAKYPKELVVIGVHSAKFTNEKESENIRQAIQRYEIEHAVVNDAEMKIWRRYGVHSWPTLMLIDPEGYVVGYVSGEGKYEVLDKVIGKLIEAAREKKQLNETPLTLTLERFKPRAVESPLKYPGKILADENSQRLFIADSNHNRIVITDFTGKVQAVAGNGVIGARDGKFEEATFFRPQGLALRGDTLYIADTENHLLRALDLKSKTVTTLAGTGEQARDFSDDANPRKVALSSPWDLALIGDQLYIAMAGMHAIWVMDLKTNVVKPFAGGGREDRVDGTLRDAAFAQPSGLATDGKKLWVADSEVSSIREIDLEKGYVSTVVGEALFDFGDVDGDAGKARLQHCLGVAYHDGLLYVADTYNDKIKIIDPQKRTAKTWLGTGKAGRADGKGVAAQLYEPNGLSIAAEKIFIADTNNHLVRVADLKTGTVATLSLEGLDAIAEVEETVLPKQTLRASGEGRLEIGVSFPKGLKLNPGSPIRYTAKVIKGDGLELAMVKRSGDLTLPIVVPYRTFETGKTAELRVELTFYYCTEGPNPSTNSGQASVCKIKTVAWRIPVEIAAEKGETSLRALYELKGPQ